MLKRDKIHIRPMLSGDLAAVVDLERRIFPYPWNKQDFMSEISIPDGFSCIAENSRIIMGYLCARQMADGMEILKIASHPAYRKKGVATLLMGKTYQKAGESQWPVLFLEVACKNTEALSFYRSQGFIPSGIRKGYYPDGTDAMNMMKHL
ncbi:GNAT family N-acetyltransferase [Desulfobotulus mexicanus]|uniref:GNAT family N-acetyltransferase n=1 Tax=Desulfobotulus mexicanus TaxID=2586642 RepID=UPI0015D0F50F|nr:GNAT family N-acetyltransferase [Desulfobotulus mexicanus]